MLSIADATQKVLQTVDRQIDGSSKHTTAMLTRRRSITRRVAARERRLVDGWSVASEDSNESPDNCEWSDDDDNCVVLFPRYEMSHKIRFRFVEPAHVADAPSSRWLIVEPGAGKHRQVRLT